MNTDELDRLRAGFESLGLSYGETVAERLLVYRDLLVKWNRVYNLTALRSAAEMIPRHLVDSLSISPFIKHGPVLDIGSGAGLPGIPLAVVHPALEFTLLDTATKRTRFMTQAVSELALDNVKVVNARIEDYPAPAAFATITSRAFASLPDFVRAGAPLLAGNGRFVAMKGQVQVSETEPLERHWSIAVERLDYPGRNGERHAVILSRRAS